LATVPAKRKSPRKLYATSSEDNETSEEIESDTDEIINNESCSTELTMVDIKSMEEELEEMKQKLKGKMNHQNLHWTTLYALSFYTGFPSHSALMACFKFLGPAVNELIYWNSKLGEVKRKGSLVLIDEFFLFLVQLRLGLLEQDLADWVGLTCARIFTKTSFT